MFEMFSGHWHARALDTHFNCCSFRLSSNVFQFSLLKMSRERTSYDESPEITLPLGFGVSVTSLLRFCHSYPKPLNSNQNVVELKLDRDRQEFQLKQMV
jgi:hypothetical protein